MHLPRMNGVHPPKSRTALGLGAVTASNIILAEDAKYLEDIGNVAHASDLGLHALRRRDRCFGNCHGGGE